MDSGSFHTPLVARSAKTPCSTAYGTLNLFRVGSSDRLIKWPGRFKEIEGLGGEVPRINRGGWVSDNNYNCAHRTAEYSIPATGRNETRPEDSCTDEPGDDRS